MKKSQTVRILNAVNISLLLRPGKDFNRTSPPEIIISKPTIIDGVNQDALELQKQSYSDDYEILIQKYMEKIRNAQKNK